MVNNSTCKTVSGYMCTCSGASLPALHWAWCWWGEPPPGGQTERPESLTTERWCGHISRLRSYTGKGHQRWRQQRRGEMEGVSGKKRKESYPDWFWVHEGCCDLAGRGETEIISSDCSTSQPPSHKPFPVTACPKAGPIDTITDRTTRTWYQPTPRCIDYIL